MGVLIFVPKFLQLLVRQVARDSGPVLLNRKAEPMMNLNKEDSL